MTSRSPGSLADLEGARRAPASLPASEVPRPATKAPDPPGTITGRRAQQRRPAPRKEEPSGVTGTTVELPLELAEKLRAHAKTEGWTLEWVCLVAVQATYDRLKGVFPAPTELALFPNAAPPSRRPARSSGATRRVTLRTRQANLAGLDQVAAELGAPSRTALLMEALRLYFADHMDHS